jgi:hypothetical protein
MRALRTLPHGQYGASMAVARKRQQYVGPLYKVEVHRLREVSAQFDWLLDRRCEAEPVVCCVFICNTETGARNAGGSRILAFERKACRRRKAGTNTLEPTSVTSKLSRQWWPVCR